jgi:acetyl-CoA C-acetyltransferase
MENMTRVPHFLPRARLGYRMGHDLLVDGMYRDGFDCPLAGQVMGATAETLAEQYAIPRKEQDAFAARSQNKAEAAWEAGRFASQIAPVTVKTRKGETVVERDEHFRTGVTAESLARLPAVFRKDGTVTAGNSSGITDGAAALVVMSEAEAVRRKARVLAWLEAGTTAGVDPKVMGIGPVPAVRALEERTGRALADYDLVELNEAFAAQALAVDRDLHMDHDRLNVNGGAIALGHPIGATGARIAVTLLHEMERRDARLGLATLCVSGGMGLAASFVREP